LHTITDLSDFLNICHPSIGISIVFDVLRSIVKELILLYPLFSWGVLGELWLNRFKSCQFRPRSSFSCLDIWTNRQATSGVYAITVTTSAYHSRRCGRL